MILIKKIAIKKIKKEQKNKWPQNKATHKKKVLLYKSRSTEIRLKTKYNKGNNVSVMVSSLVKADEYVLTILNLLCVIFF